MKKTKLEKGITLVALIITIIVLLILAVVAITTVSDGGIIKHAQDAQEEYEKAEEKEKVTLATSEAYLAGQGTITEENLKDGLDSNFGAGKYSLDNSNSEYFKITIIESGREYKVYKNGKVESTLGSTPEEGGGENPPQTEMPVATVGIKVEENSTIDGKAYSSTNPIIPAGFTAINTTTSSWDAESGPEVDNGLVIRDESGNEFVWVPVTEDIDENGYGLNTSDNYCREPDVVTGVEPSETVDSASGTKYDAVASNLQKAGCTEDLNDDGKVNAYDFKIQLTNEYKIMAESVNKYNGFYVGRFETSKNGANPQSKRSNSAYGSKDAIVTEYGDIWYDLYALNKKYSTSSVQGSMTWGCQYDAMIIWMGDAARTTITGYNTERSCGTAPDDVIKNVYDIYGNSFEHTMETRR